MRYTTLLCALLLADCALAEKLSQEPFHLHRESEHAVGYAQAIKVGDTVYVSGTVGRGATLEEQLSAAYTRIGITLDSFGADFADIIKETIYTTDFDALIAAAPARQTFYGDHVPAATWVGIDRLYMPEARIEIEVTAVVGSGRMSD